MLDQGRFVLSKSVAIEQYKTIKDIADIISYSFKTNNDVGKILEEYTDSMFSVHMIDSLALIKDKSRIWFLAQAWSDEELDILTRQGVHSFVVDNKGDLTVLLNYLDKKKIKINLMLRMKLKENTIHTGKYFVFGMYSREINRLVPELRTNDNIGLLGVHFHRKTQNIAEWSLKDEISQTLECETLKLIDVLDIGGGLPVKYKNYTDLNIESTFGKIKDLKAWLNENDVKLIIEPGRFICAPAIKLISVIKEIYGNNIIINCSIYNSNMDTIIGNIKLPVENELEKGVAYTIKGSTPCSMDIFRYRVFLENPKVGDEIIFLNAGAYNFTTDFCNLNKLETRIDN